MTKSNEQLESVSLIALAGVVGGAMTDGDRAQLARVAKFKEQQRQKLLTENSPLGSAVRFQDGATRDLLGQPTELGRAVTFRNDQARQLIDDAGGL